MLTIELGRLQAPFIECHQKERFQNRLNLVDAQVAALLHLLFIFIEIKR